MVVPKDNIHFERGHRYAVVVIDDPGLGIIAQSCRSSRELRGNYVFWQQYASDKKLGEVIPVQILENGGFKVLDDILEEYTVR